MLFYIEIEGHSLIPSVCHLHPLTERKQHTAKLAKSARCKKCLAYCPSRNNDVQIWKIWMGNQNYNYTKHQSVFAMLSESEQVRNTTPSKSACSLWLERLGTCAWISCNASAARRAFHKNLAPLLFSIRGPKPSRKSRAQNQYLGGRSWHENTKTERQQDEKTKEQNRHSAAQTDMRNRH